MKWGIRVKILYVTTISNTVNAFLIPHIKMLIDEGNSVDVAFNIQEEVRREVLDMGCKVHFLGFQRYPLSKENYNACKKLKRVMQEENYDIVHTHTPVASACVRLVCRNIKSVKVIYTAHGFHFFKGAPIINWLLYYPIERWLFRYTDTLITINKEDFIRAKKTFKANKIEYVPGVGIDIDKFSKIEIDKKTKLKELGIPENSFVVLSIGELNKNKNHETIIRAIDRVNNHLIHYLICGQGPLEHYLKDLIIDLGLEKKIHLLGVRKDIGEICKASDLFVMPSFREGLSVALMEALASGLPVLCSNIRGNSDLIEEGKNGFLIKPDNVDEFSKGINKLYESVELREKFSKENNNRIGKYSIQNVIANMKLIYLMYKNNSTKVKNERQVVFDTE